ENRGQAEGLRYKGGAELVRSRDARDRVGDGAKLRGREGELGDNGGFGFVASGEEQFLASAPDGRVAFDGLHADKGFERGELRGDTSGRGFEENVDLWRCTFDEAGLQRRMGELGILDSEDDALGIGSVAREAGEGGGLGGQRMQAKDGADDDAESTKSAG